MTTLAIPTARAQNAATGLSHARPAANAPSGLEKINVFSQNSDGYHTFRIPSLLTTPQGAVLALCEGRRQSANDFGDVDLVCKRSTDHGRTWTPLQVIWNDGTNTCGNACPVVDTPSGYIYLLMTWNRGEDREPAIIARQSHDTRRVFVSRSTDDGLTWSTPREITSQVKREDWTWYATGPGAGIQMQHGNYAGRLVVPCDHIEAESRKYRSHIIYSDDHGATWKLGGSAPLPGVNECEVVELEGGQLLLNMRNYTPDQFARQVARSTDGGQTWIDQKHDPVLIEPICQASLRRVAWAADGQPGLILFSNPASRRRENLTVRGSLDEGQTWPFQQSIEPGPSAYSCLATLPDHKIGVLYESGLRSPYETIFLARFTPGWVTNQLGTIAEPVDVNPFPPVTKASISFRIGVPQWSSDSRYRELLAWFEKYKDVTDELTFFTSATHPPLPMEEIRQRAQVLAGRITQAKKLGYRAGINVLSTIGHHNENLRNSLTGPYTRATDPDGAVCQGSFCPNDAAFKGYVQELYRVVAGANPDYVWIDDDVRLAGHMPIGLTCFCEHCLARFAQESGRTWTRPGLKSALFDGPLEGRLALRKAWLAHNRTSVARLLGMIEQTVHRERPGLPLGFMSGERFYEGYDFDGWAQVLSGPSRAPVYWRPGGGFYEDSATPGLAGKSHEIGRQVSLLPPDVRAIQSEIENFPYQLLKKAARTTVLEAASHMAAGCTGAAFNVLSGNDEPLDEFEPMLAAAHEARPFFDLLARNFQRLAPIGLWAAWNKDSWATDTGMLSLAPALWEIGLPAAYSSSAAAVTLLYSQNVATLSDAELKKVLSGGVYMDAETLAAINRRGLSHLTGMAPGQAFAVDGIEEMTQHPLNGAYGGRQRDSRQSFNHRTALGLELIDPTAQSLARLVDYVGHELAACTFAIFENQLGGRVAVAGYFPWSFLHSLSKTTQLKSVMRWLSKDRLPAYVSSFHKVNVWARESKTDGLAVAIVNSSFDPATQLDLALRTSSERLDTFDMKGLRQTISATRREGPYQHFVLPIVDPWSMRLVTTGPP